MGCIVCATRGGEGSRAVQQRAIELAVERSCHLVFLYVIDSDRAEGLDGHLQRAVDRELSWIARTLLAIAVKRASDANVDAGSSVRRGDVLEEIRQFLVDKDADLLLLGAPRGTNALVMGDDAVEQLAMAIEAASAIPFEIVRPDQVTA